MVRDKGYEALAEIKPRGRPSKNDMGRPELPNYYHTKHLNDVDESHTISNSPDLRMALNMLKKAFCKVKVPQGLFLHSDQE